MERIALKYRLVICCLLGLLSAPSVYGELSLQIEAGAESSDDVSMSNQAGNGGGLAGSKGGASSGSGLFKKNLKFTSTNIVKGNVSAADSAKVNIGGLDVGDGKKDNASGVTMNNSYNDVSRPIQNIKVHDNGNNQLVQNVKAQDIENNCIQQGKSKVECAPMVAEALFNNCLVRGNSSESDCRTMANGYINSLKETEALKQDADEMAWLNSPIMDVTVGTLSYIMDTFFTRDDGKSWLDVSPSELWRDSLYVLFHPVEKVGDFVDDLSLGVVNFSFDSVRLGANGISSVIGTSESKIQKNNEMLLSQKEYTAESLAKIFKNMVSGKDISVGNISDLGVGLFESFNESVLENKYDNKKIDLLYSNGKSVVGKVNDTKEKIDSVLEDGILEYANDKVERYIKDRYEQAVSNKKEEMYEKLEGIAQEKGLIAK
ncbi:MAG: hypothetical protein LBU39_06485 [Desulfobulbaceae bacterium]|nr:hypothetical protein [Desulfobulbaceae bacterium]